MVTACGRAGRAPGDIALREFVRVGRIDAERDRDLIKCDFGDKTLMEAAHVACPIGTGGWFGSVNDFPVETARIRT